MKQQNLWEWCGEPVPTPTKKHVEPVTSPIRRAEYSHRMALEPTSSPTRGTVDVSRVESLGPSSKVAERSVLAHRLHEALEELLGIVELIVTDNRRRMVTVRSSDSSWTVRVHHLFLGCPEPVVIALAQMVRGDREARAVVRRYVQKNRHAIRRRPRPEQLRTSGRFHNLERALQNAMRLVPTGLEAPEVAITWGRNGRGRRSIRLGSYDFESRLIRIHPALDRAWVPAFFVEFVVYHELLHALCPPEVIAGRRRVHTDAFLHLERRFPYYEEAMVWEDANIRRLLERAA